MRLVPMRLKFVRKRALIDLFKYARASKCLMDLNGARNDVFGDVSVLSIVAFHIRHYIIKTTPHAFLEFHDFRTTSYFTVLI